MITPHRAGQVTGAAIVLLAALWVGSFLLRNDPPPDLTPGEILLDAFDTSPRACVSRDEILSTATANGLRWVENPPLDCTDAPEGTTWLAVTAETRTRHYAFGPDGCRITVSPAPCP